MDIEWLKKLKNSLTVKVFLITFLVLMIISCIVYYIITLVTPLTFSMEENSRIDQKTQELVEELKEVKIKDAKSKLRSFSINYHVMVLLKLDNGNVLDPLNEYGWGISNSYEREQDMYSVLTQPGQEVMEYHYEVQFKEAETTNTLIIYQNTQSKELLFFTFQKILPWILLITLVLSILIAYLFTYFITKPIVRISAISKKMALLQLDVRCKENKEDEIGVLSKSLNEMAIQLDTTLQELQKANNALKRELEAEREKEKRRWDFFSAVSHELKTPLTILQGQLDGMIQKVGNYQDRDRYLRKSMRVVNNMQEMVGDILIVLRTETSNTQLQTKEINFSELLRNVLIPYLELIEQKNLVLEVNILDFIRINGNEQLLSKVISNLLSNAIEYTNVGETIYIDMKVNEQNLIFCIENVGAYIPEKEFKNIIEPFYRLENSRNRKNGGTGLGLYLVSKILNQHHFLYKIENTKRGVLFTITIPLIKKF